jgi:hypothetical protein
MDWGELREMIDMTNNRVPYGLLTDEEKAALREHKKAGGKFESWSDLSSAWFDFMPMHFYDGLIYRTLPLPKTQDVIAWEKLPDWAEWVARDGDGTVCAYDEEPECRGDEWVFGGSECTRIDYWPEIVQIGTCDWKDSKQRRPRLRERRHDPAA